MTKDEQTAAQTGQASGSGQMESTMSALNRPSAPRYQLLMRLTRWLLLALALTTFTLTLVGAAMFPAYVTAHPEQLAPTIAWTPEMTLASLEQLGWPAAAVSFFYIVPSLLNLFASGAMTFIMLSRKADEWFGLFVAFVFLLGAQGGDMLLPLFGLVPGIEWWYGFSSSLSWQLMFVFLLLFPNGRFVPRWTRWTLLGWVAVNLLSPLVSATDPFFTAFTLGLAVIAIGSQPYRYFRRADAIQRQQTKWVVFTVAIAFTVLFSLSMPNVFIAPAVDSGAALLRSAGIRAVSQLGAALIPLSMGIAILRYRLWDIDVIIRKTLVYGLLTALLALVYLGSVVVLQTLFGALTGERSPVVIVISTLVIAAISQPLRRRVQDGIDRRFYRRKYDATKALADFAATARDEVDLDALANELLRVVAETMQPQRVSVWLLDPKSAHPASFTDASHVQVDP